MSRESVALTAECSLATRPAVRAVVQRVSCAWVSVAGEVVGEIGPGFVVLLGIGRSPSHDRLRRPGVESRAAMPVGGDGLLG